MGNPSIKPHPTGECPPGEMLQLIVKTGEQVCAPPNSFPQYLADSDAWQMAPAAWIPVYDKHLGCMRYVPPQ